MEQAFGSWVSRLATLEQQQQQRPVLLHHGTTRTEHTSRVTAS
jgi:hypothetical protein